MSDEDGAAPTSARNYGEGTSRDDCDRCGTPIDTSEWYPVARDRTPDDAVRFRSFCSEDCQEAWLEDERN